MLSERVKVESGKDKMTCYKVSIIKIGLFPETWFCNTWAFNEKFRTMVDAVWDSSKQEDGPNMPISLGQQRPSSLPRSTYSGNHPLLKLWLPKRILVSLEQTPGAVTRREFPASWFWGLDGPFLDSSGSNRALWTHRQHIWNITSTPRDTKEPASHSNI